MRPRRSRAPALTVLPLAFALTATLGCRRAMRDDAEAPASEVGTPPAATPAPGMQVRTLEVAGRTRRYLVFVPAQLTSPAPLVITLHGGGGTAEGVERQTHWGRLAREKGFVLAYPQGTGKSWDDGREDTPSRSVKEHVDDVAFLAAVVADVAARASIDPARVYMNGISNGAFMTSRFACERADLVSGIGLVAATIGPDVLANCRPKRPVAVISFNGTSDPLVPFDGGVVHLGPFVRGRAASVAESTELWVTQDSCKKTPEQSSVLADHDPGDGSTVRLETYGACADGKAVHQYTIEGGGHAWPGGQQYLPPRIVGRVNRDIDATERMWTFFSTH